MPNCVLEALACGVPVVSTNVGGVPYIVEDERTALLVPPDDADRMANAILRILGDAQLHQRLAQAGAQEVRRYTWNQVAPVLRSAYLAALGQTAGRLA